MSLISIREQEIADVVNSADKTLAPIASDQFPVIPADTSRSVRKFKWSTLLAAIKTRFDSLYVSVSFLTSYVTNALTGYATNASLSGYATTGSLTDYTQKATLTAAGSRYRATGAGTIGEIKPSAALGNVSGTATLSLTPDAVHTMTITDAITSWSLSGLASGEGCEIVLANSGSKAVATTGLTADWTDALADIAATSVRLVILYNGSAYRAVAKELA